MYAKSLSFIILATLLLSLSGCGGQASNSAPLAAATPNLPSDPIAALKQAGSYLDSTVAALQKNDVPAAKASYKQFDDSWVEVEVSIRSQSADIYKEIETNMAAVRRELVLVDNPAATNILPLVVTLQRSYDSGAKLAETASLSSNAPNATPISGPQVAAAEQKIKDYLAGYIAKLTTDTANFTTAVKARDLNKAKSLYSTARYNYEVLEFLAEAFPDLDLAIDGRANDYPQAEADPNWMGFHPLEKAVYIDGKLDARTDKIADRLLADTTALSAKIKELKVDSAIAVKGAGLLVAEIQESKITGEEERYSNTDLIDFRANLDGAEFAYSTYADFVVQRSPALDKQIRADFDTVEQALAVYFPNKTPVSYANVDQPARNELARKIGVLASSLNQVPIILGLS